MWYCIWRVQVSWLFYLLISFYFYFGIQDSLLLGQVHVSLLKLLVSDIDQDLSRGFLPLASKNRKFLALLHSVSTSISRNNKDVCICALRSVHVFKMWALVSVFIWFATDFSASYFKKQIYGHFYIIKLILVEFVEMESR